MQLIKSQLSGIKCMFKHQDLQMFGLKVNKYEQFSPTWSLVAQILEFIFYPLEVVVRYRDRRLQWVKINQA